MVLARHQQVAPSKHADACISLCSTVVHTDSLTQQTGSAAVAHVPIFQQSLLDISSIIKTDWIFYPSNFFGGYHHIINYADDSQNYRKVL